MGVTYDVRCVDCKCIAPTVGDGGFLGCPSIHEDDEDSNGPSFGYYYIPLSGLCICPMDLQRFCDWLFAHGEHEVHMAGDGIATPPHLPPGALYWDDDERASAASELLGDPSSDGYTWGRYEIRCRTCGVTYTAKDPEWMLECHAVVDDDTVHDFLERWDSGEGVVAHRIYGIADPTSAFIPGLIQFLRSHAPPRRPARRFTDHPLEACIVAVRRDPDCR